MKNWEENVRRVVPYVPGEQPKRERMIKLNTNENPYPPAPGVKKVLESFQTDRLRLYPDPVVGKLVKAIADYITVKPGGRGCAREAVEMTMKAQGEWVLDVNVYKNMY